MRILITGAAGNLGSFLTKHLLGKVEELRLMIHKRDVSEEIKKEKGVKVFRADLMKPETLVEPVRGVDVVVHFAGVLFRPRPEKFLPITNVVYFQNLLDVAIKERVKRVILISFPHVEGETTKENPATGRLDKEPISIHAKTRLEEEKYLFSRTEGTETVPVSLRVGMVYGKGVLMIEAARWLAKHWLLGVWKKPTWIHLISLPDFLSATEAAIIKPNVQGIYHIGDDGYLTLQDFLDKACTHWGYKKPWRMPEWMIYLAAWFCEQFALLFNTKAPLTKDFIDIGKVSYYGDTRRMKAELLPELKYPTLSEGLILL